MEGVRRIETKEQKALVNELPHPQSFEKAGYTRLTRPGGARESFNSKLPGNYTSVTVLSRAKAQNLGPNSGNIVF